MRSPQDRTSLGRAAGGLSDRCRVDAQLLRALGPLARVVSNDTRDLTVAGDGRAWVRSGSGFRPTDVVLDRREVRLVATGLIELGGGRLDDALPMGDAALAGRVRVHAVLPPIARDGPLVSLRFPREHPVSTADYVLPTSWDWRTLVSESVLVCGVTGSGKSTLVETVLGLCAPDERIVVVEDIRELSPQHPHAVFLSTRTPNAEGAGSVTLAQLVRESLRMSPDRIVVGEVRGAEIVDLLVAMTSGHRGLTTIHAGSLADVPARLLALGGIGGLTTETTSQLVRASFTRVVLCRSTPDGVTLSMGSFTETDGKLEVVG